LVLTWFFGLMAVAAALGHAWWAAIACAVLAVAAFELL